MSVVNPSALNMIVPNYGIDQIIGITSGTLNITAPTSGTSPTTATANFAHGFGDSAYFSGIFTADGGTTYNDFGAMIPVISLGFPVFQTVDCNAVCDATNLTITASNYYNFVTGTGTAATVSYKVYLFAKNTMASPVNPLATSETLQYSSGFNYQKVFMRGTTNLTVASGTTGSTNVTHSLGYVPKVRAFRTNSASPSVLRPISEGLITDPRVHITDQLLTFYADETGFGGVNLNTNIQYRIYLDS